MIVRVPDGWEFIRNSQDVVDIIRKYITDEVADYVETIFREGEEEVEYERLCFDSDIGALESEVEEYRDALDEVNSRLQQLSCKAEDKPGLSKKKVLEEIDNIWQYINKIL